jgi:serine protease Do
MGLKKRFKNYICALLVFGMTLGFGYSISGPVTESAAAAAAADSKQTEVLMVPINLSDLAEKVRPGVVYIKVVKTVKNVRSLLGPHPFGGGSPFEGFEGQPDTRQQRGQGSGFLISPDGYIVSNNHVVDGAEEIKVKLHNGKEYPAKMVGRDSKTDLALIKIEGATDLHFLKLGDSDKLKVGSWVVAVGNPFGLEQTVTAGIVSGKGRSIGSGPYDDYIQTDASINPGNSGGPLVNMAGEVVGINTSILRSGQGIGFAVPVNMAKEIIPQLKAKGHVTRGWLGIHLQEVTPELAKSFGLKENKGALVTQIQKGTPAEKAGIERGDILLEFDGKEITSSKVLPMAVALTPVGKTVPIKLLRNGKEMERQVTIGEMEREKEAVREFSKKRLGLTIQAITPESARTLGIQSETGVYVAAVEPGSPASDAGIRVGDVIAEVNRKPIKDMKDFQEIFETEKDKGNILFLIQRNKDHLFVALAPK